MFSKENPIRVVGISGSLRKRSNNTALLRAAGGSMPDDMVLEIVEVHDIPIYNADDEFAVAQPHPENLLEVLEEAIRGDH